ncbi:MAG: sulfotransferase [Proteobacteria bacterium]|nr:sulfotransferase [Pseudomonadota bacterium]
MILKAPALTMGGHQSDLATAPGRWRQALALETAGDFDGAFQAFAEGNRLRRRGLDVEAYRTSTRDLVLNLPMIFRPELFAAHGGRRGGKGLIFIIGMPRSGSTLVEQILASHPRVHALGETPALPSLVHSQFPYQSSAPPDFKGLRAAYLAEARKAGWPGWGAVTDKMLTNWQRVGIIHLLFPEAVILHTVRDPMDTCFSCFRTLFDRGNEVMFDLAEIGELYRAYRQAMAFWADVLPGRVLDVNHEALVADPERGIREIVAACGLPWHDACLRFHELDRDAGTASAQQVRRPIFRESVGRWRHYRDHLGPLIEALGPFAAAA